MVTAVNNTASKSSSARPIRVMLVDDSAVVRGLVSRVLKEDPGIEIIATAFNGRSAINQLTNHKPDVILLDVEMPEMDGLTALPEILKKVPGTKVIMVSTLTERNADISLKALELGAADYVAKPQSIAGGGSITDFYRELIQKIKALMKEGSKDTALTYNKKSKNIAAQPAHKINAIAIGASTGGPQALIQLFGQLKNSFPTQPIFITQHMPPTFTTILSKHLSDAGGIPCLEGEDGMVVSPGKVYIAPGDYHMEVAKEGVDIVIRNNQKPPVNFCRPAVDVMLSSLVKIYGKNLLTIILTGMGQDGMVAAKEAHEAEGTVISQDEESSVVWGMPKAVAATGICKAILPLNEISEYITLATQNWGVKNG